MSIPSPSPTALALVAGLAVAGLAAPQSARADSFSFGFSVGERDGWRGHREHRGERHHKRRRQYHHHRGHRPVGPPPWAFHRPQPRYYGPHCQLVWSHWHQGFVTVCR
ncbi:MAG TPA: hypothetical protein VIR45_06320 [Kiloniellaceae bacterium]